MALLTIPSSESEKPDDLSSYRHRRFIGYIGLALPWLLILIVLWRDGPLVWEGLDSVSAYYYTGANALFVGMLFVLALFLFAYEGYKNKYQKHDRRWAKAAALGALLVAFFPTAAPQVEGITALAWWTKWVGWLHFGGAFLLFGAFAVFCLWLFRATEKSAAEPGRNVAAIPDPDPGKKLRNHFYLFSGLVIVGCMIRAGYNLANSEPEKSVSIFWPEAIALTFFALSWLVKGHWLESMAGVARAWLTPGDAGDDKAPKR
jgi:heme A synthase